jgi:hypothetical protein
MTFGFSNTKHKELCNLATFFTSKLPKPKKIALFFQSSLSYRSDDQEQANAGCPTFEDRKEWKKTLTKFELFIEPNLPINPFRSTVLHELAHVFQFITGTCEPKVTVKNRLDQNTPWEVDANAKEQAWLAEYNTLCRQPAFSI